MLLLDEPLSALDAHTKDAVRLELQELLQAFELPTLIVTHDYEDAAALAGTVGVLVEGELRQLGSPAELVSQPSDPFVASFTGANLLRGHVQLLDDGLTRVRLESGEIVYSTDTAQGDVGVVVYPWDVSIGRDPRGRLGAESDPRRDRLGLAGRQPRARAGRPADGRGDRSVGRAPRAGAGRSRDRLVQGDRHAARAARGLELERLRRAERVEEAAVVADEHGRALVARERELELLDRLEVEVVRRLVEHERVHAAGGQ